MDILWKVIVSLEQFQYPRSCDVADFMIGNVLVDRSEFFEIGFPCVEKKYRSRRELVGWHSVNVGWDDWSRFGIQSCSIVFQLGVANIRLSRLKRSPYFINLSLDRTMTWWWWW